MSHQWAVFALNYSTAATSHIACSPSVFHGSSGRRLGGAVDREKGMRGYYVIMGSFVAMTFILSLAGAESSVPF